LPGINVPPAIAGGTLSESPSASHPTGHHSCRHPVIVIDGAQGGPPRPRVLAESADQMEDKHEQSTCNLPVGKLLRELWAEVGDGVKG
jgi:hypothetical protein